MGGCQMTPIAINALLSVGDSQQATAQPRLRSPALPDSRVKGRWRLASWPRCSYRHLPESAAASACSACGGRVRSGGLHSGDCAPADLRVQPEALGVALMQLGDHLMSRFLGQKLACEVGVES